jgi:hypothetical protein
MKLGMHIMPLEQRWKTFFESEFPILNKFIACRKDYWGGGGVLELEEF